MIYCQILSLFILVLLLGTLVVKERGNRNISLFITSIILAMLNIAFSVYKSTAYATELINDPQPYAAAIEPFVNLFVYLAESLSLAFFCLFLKRKLFSSSRSTGGLLTALSFFSAPLTSIAAFLSLHEIAFAVIFLLQAILIGVFIAFSPVERNVRVWFMIAGAVCRRRLYASGQGRVHGGFHKSRLFRSRQLRPRRACLARLHVVH